MNQVNSPTLRKCAIHPQNSIIYVNLSPEIGNHLVCAQCLKTSKNYDLSSYYSIEQIVNSEEQESIPNWPPLQDQSTHQEIQDLLLEYQSPSYDTTIEQFEQFQAVILQKLGELRKKIYTRNHQISSFRDTLQNKIYSISGKDELCNLLVSQLNIDEFEQRIRAFIDKKMNEKLQNSQTMSEFLKNQKSYLETPQFSLEVLKSRILEPLNEYLKGHIQPEQSSIISNNQDQFTQTEQIIYYQPNQASIVVNPRAYSQYPQTQLLIQDFFSKIHIQEKEFEEDFYSIQQDPITQNILITQNERKLGLVYFKADLTKESKYIIRFDLQCPSQNSIIIGLLSKSLAPFYFISCTNTGKNFGKESEHGLEFCNKIIKGQDLKEASSNKQTVEMRIDIRNRMIEFLDFPNNNSLNQLNDQYLLDSEDTYYLCIEFNSRSENERSQVQISQIQEVIEF